MRIQTYLLLLIALAFNTLHGQNNFEIVPQLGHTASIRCVALSADGRTAASGADDLTVKLWDVASGKLLRTINTETLSADNGIRSVALSADGRMVVLGGLDKTVRVWEVANGKEVRTMTGHASAIASVAFSADGRTVVSGGADKTVKVWELTSGKELRTMIGHTEAIASVALSADGGMAVSVGEDKTLKVWDVVTGKEVRTMTGHTEAILSVALSADGHTAVSGGKDKTLKVWDVASGKEVRTMTGHTEAILSVALSANGHTAVSGGKDKTLKVWDVASGKELRSMVGGTEIASMALSADAGTVVSTGNDETVQVWDVTSGKELRKISGRVDAVLSVAFSADGRTAVSSGADKTLKVWDVASGRELRTMTGHTGYVSSVALSADGHTAVSGGADKTMKVWDVVSGKELRTMMGHTEAILSVALSADGHTAVSGGKDKTLKVWDVATGKELRTMTGHTEAILSVALSADGHTAVSGGKDKTLKVWDVTSGRELSTMTGHTSFITSAALSADGRTAVSGGADTTVKLWDLARGNEPRTFTGPQFVTSLALSADGLTVASALAGGTVKVWDLVTGHQLGSFATESIILGLAFVPGQLGRVAIASLDGTLQIWNSINSKKLVSLISSRDGDSVAVTPSGYYDASPGGEDLVAFLYKGGPSEVQNFKGARNIPAVVRATLELGDEQVAIKRVVGNNVRQIGEYYPFVRIALEQRDEQGEIHVSLQEGRNYSVPIVAHCNSGGKLKRILVKVDGSTEKQWELQTDDTQMRFSTMLKEGEHVIVVEAMDDQGLPSQDQVKIIVARKPQRLFLLAVAASEYPKAGLETLKLAQQDVDTIVSAFEADPLFFEENNILTLSPNGKARATRDEIMDDIDKHFQGAGENDWLVLYISGHGETDSSGQFRFLAEDVIKGQNDTILSAKTISGSDLMGWLTDARKVGRRYLIVDSCYSGKLRNLKNKDVAGHVMDRESAEHKEELKDAMEQSGSLLITAGWGDQKAKESDKGSVMTLALCYAMQHAKTDEKGAVSVTNLYKSIQQFFDQQHISGQQPPVPPEVDPTFPFWFIQHGANASQGSAK